jgi:branched-chain amino acid transport system permease protein
VTELLQQLINGLALGAIYALIALGYTMVYGVLRFINFAHSDVFMVGAFAGYYLARWLPGGPATGLLVLLGAMVICALLGMLIEKLAYRPLRGAPRLAPLITAIGISIILQHLAMMIWSRNPLAFPQILENRVFHVAGATVTTVQLAIWTVAVLMMGALTAMVYRTRLGIAMRATSQNPQVAGLMGIDINLIIAATFAIGAALAAIAGVMVGTYYGIAHYTMGSLLGLKAFCAAVLGGIGNIPGAMLGGILLGVVEALGAGYIGDFTNNWFGSNYQDVFAFIVLILVLVFRPSGLLGERVGDRA